MGRIPWNKESFVPGGGVYAFSQEAAPAWAWSMDRDDAQMKPSIPRELGQDLVEHQSVVDNHKSHVKALEFAVGGSIKAWCANLSASSAIVRDCKVSMTSVTEIKAVKWEDSNATRVGFDLKLSDLARKFLIEHGPHAFAGKYGTHFIYGIVYGGTMVCTMKIDAKTRQQKTQLLTDTNVKAEAMGKGAGAHFRFNVLNEEQARFCSRTLEIMATGRNRMTSLGSINEVDEKIADFNKSPGRPVFAEIRTFQGNMSYDIVEAEYWSSKICLFNPDPDVAREVRRLDDAWCHFLYLQASNGEFHRQQEQVSHLGAQLKLFKNEVEKLNTAAAVKAAADNRVIDKLERLLQNIQVGQEHIMS